MAFLAFSSEFLACWSMSSISACGLHGSRSRWHPRTSARARTAGSQGRAWPWSGCWCDPAQHGAHRQDGQHKPWPSWPSPQSSWPAGACRRSQRAASTDRVLVGIRELLLELGQLGLKGALGLGLGVGVILLSTELIGKTGSINHGLLGLLLRVLGLLEHVVDLSVHGVHGALDGPLVAGGLGVDRGHLIDGGARLGELGLGLALAPLGRVEQGA